MQDGWIHNLGHLTKCVLQWSTADHNPPTTVHPQPGSFSLEFVPVIRRVLYVKWREIPIVVEDCLKLINILADVSWCC